MLTSSIEPALMNISVMKQNMPCWLDGAAIEEEVETA